MTDANREFITFAETVKTRFGIDIRQKQSMVESRLGGMLNELGLNSLSAFYRSVSEGSASLLGPLIDKLSTNHTYFYREPEHFDLLSNKVLPEVCENLKRAQRFDLRFWCAAAATGEEPYLLGMLIMEHLGQSYARWTAGLLATDISDRALTIAKAGLYRSENVQKLPAALVKKYFDDEGGGNLRIKPELRREVLFRRFNLINAKWPFRGRFQIIFCRNVMIYFDDATRAELVSKMQNILEPGGYLFLGHAESLPRGVPGLEAVSAAAYRKTGR